jgi:hypothetical protein
VGPELSRRRIPGKPEIPPLRCSPSLAQFRPLVEPHGGVASFDDPNQASDEEDSVRTVIPLAVSSVDSTLIGSYTSFSSARGSGRDGGGKPQPNPAVSETLTP